MIILFLIILITFGISSIWLYSPGPQFLREYIVNKFSFIAPLTYCQLCCSFWIAFWLFMLVMINSGIGFSIPILIYIALLSCGVSGISWLLGAITTSALWKKAYYEQRTDIDKKYWKL